MRRNWLLNHRVFIFWSLTVLLVPTSPSFGRVRLLSPLRILVPQKRRLTPQRQTLRTFSTPRQTQSVPSAPSHTDSSEKSTRPLEEPRTPRPIIEPPVVEIPKESLKPKEPKGIFGKTLSELNQNRPKLFSRKETQDQLDPYAKIFCESPHKLVCEVSMENVPGTPWPSQILPRDPQGAFASGKKLLSYLVDNHFEYNQLKKTALQSQLSETQILVTNISGPTAFSRPPRIEVPPNYWNLFSVFHELGHMIDYKSTYPLDKAEVIRVLRDSNQESNVDALESFIKDKQAEITADKIAAKGFAFLADPHIRKLGYEPIDNRSLLKTLKSALGFLCNSQGSPEHPEGKFRINFIGADEDLRAVLGCPLRN